MKPKAEIHKVVDDDGNLVWRWERPTFGFSLYDVEREDFESWREAFRFATARHKVAGNGAQIEQAYEGSDRIGPVPRWTPLEQLRYDDKGAHDA